MPDNTSDHADRKALFCFGFGYTAAYFAHFLKQQGQWDIAGTTRDPAKKEAMKTGGIRPYLFDYNTPLADPYFVLKDITHILISTPPDDAGDPSFLIHGEDIARMPNLRWLGYLSTTGVYGDRGGGKVHENSEKRPTSKRGSRRARAEDQWLSLYQQYGTPVHIFRLAGIYGPGRSAIDSVRAGTARRIDKPGHAFNRTHVHDIIQVLWASILRPNPGAAYNVCDDHPAPSHELIEYTCRLLNIEPPPLIPFSDADVAPIVRSFYADNKHVLNNRIKEELGVRLIHPDFHSGLDACLEEEKNGEIPELAM